MNVNVYYGLNANEYSGAEAERLESALALFLAVSLRIQISHVEITSFRNCFCGTHEFRKVLPC